MPFGLRGFGADVEGTERTGTQRAEPQDERQVSALEVATLQETVQALQQVVMQTLDNAELERQDRREREERDREERAEERFFRRQCEEEERTERRLRDEREAAARELRNEQADRREHHRLPRLVPKLDRVGATSATALVQWETKLKTYIRSADPFYGPSMLDKVLDNAHQAHAVWLETDPAKRNAFHPMIPDFTRGERETHAFVCGDVTSKMPMSVERLVIARAEERKGEMSLVDGMYEMYKLFLPTSAESGEALVETLKWSSDDRACKKGELSIWLHEFRLQYERICDLGYIVPEDSHAAFVKRINFAISGGMTGDFNHFLRDWKGQNPVPAKRVTQSYFLKLLEKVKGLSDSLYLAEYEKEIKKGEKKNEKNEKEANATETPAKPAKPSKPSKPQPPKAAEEVTEANATEKPGKPAKPGNPPPTPTQPAKPAAPLDPKERPCAFILENKCRAGKECKWSHNTKLAKEWKAKPCPRLGANGGKGSCRFGKMCLFAHAASLAVPGVGLPPAIQVANVNVPDAYAEHDDQLHVQFTGSNEGALPRTRGAAPGRGESRGAGFWGIYDCAAQATVVGSSKQFQPQHGHKGVAIKTVAGQTEAKPGTARTPVGEETPALYISGARNLLAHVSVREAGWNGFTWLEKPVDPENLHIGGPCLYDREGNAHPLVERDGLAFIPGGENIEALHGGTAEVQHANTLDHQAGALFPCWECGGTDHWRQSCLAPRKKERRVANGTWPYDSLPTRSAGIIARAMRKAGETRTPTRYWVNSSEGTEPSPEEGDDQECMDLDVDADWNVLLVTRTKASDPLAKGRRIVRVYFGQSEEKGESVAFDAPVKVRFETTCESYHAALDICDVETRAMRRAREDPPPEPGPDARVGGELVQEPEVTEGKPTEQQISRAKEIHQKRKKARQSIAKTFVNKYGKTLAHRMLGHKIVPVDGCIICDLAKQKRAPHKHVGVSKERGKRYWHIDAAGRYPTSRNGSRYMLAVSTEGVGDRPPMRRWFPIPSRHSRVMKNALAEFAKYPCADNPVWVRSDGANDFKGSTTEWLSEVGAEHAPTYRYSPWENGTAESCVGVGAAAIRAAMIDSNAPHDLWHLAARWVSDTDLVAGGWLTRKDLGPFGCLVTMVKEEPEKRDGKSFEPVSSKCFLVGYEQDGGVTVGLEIAGRLRLVRTKNYKIHADTKYWPEPPPAQWDPKEQGAGPAALGEDEHAITWVECALCKKWRELLGHDITALQECDDEEVTCTDLGILCTDVQDPRAFEEREVSYFSFHTHLDEDDEGLIAMGSAYEIHLFEPVTRKKAFSDEEYVDGKTYAEMFREAMGKELGMYLQHGALKMEEVRERLDVKDPEHLFAILNPIFGFKDSELPDRRLHRAKVRIVACREWDKFGAKADGVTEEECLWSACPSYEVIRLVMAIATIIGKEFVIVDWPAAYLGAQLKGPKVWGRLPKEAWPEHWHGKYKDPVVPVCGAVYGLVRAGHDYNAKADRVYEERGWESTRHKDGDPCVFVRKSGGEYPDMIARWTDDNLVAAEKGTTTGILDQLAEEFPHPETARLSLPQKYVGMNTDVKRVDENLRHIVYSQAAYVQNILDEFVEETKQKGGPNVHGKKAPLPCGATREELLEAFEDDSKDGADAKAGTIFWNSCRKHVGALMFVMRCTRPDIAYALSVIASVLDRWSKRADAFLLHLFGYLKNTWNLQLEAWLDIRDILEGKIRLILKTDASFAPGKATRGTSGYLVYLSGPRSIALIAWNASKQKVESLHTAESELHALVSGTRALIRISNMADCLLGKGAKTEEADGNIDEAEPAIGEELEIDAEATRRALRVGHSEKFGHVRRTGRISLAWAHRFWNKKKVSHASGKEFAPDALTKSLPAPAVERYLADLCLRSP